MAANSYDDIRVRDRVTYRTPHGQTNTGTAMMYGTHGWVLDRGNGQPVVVSEENFISMRRARARKKDNIGQFLFGKPK
jgi:hypothetical protein